MIHDFLQFQAVKNDCSDVSSSHTTKKRKKDVSSEVEASALSMDKVMATSNDRLDVHASSFDKVFMAGEEGSAAIMLVKFLINRNISLDVINDSHFRTLLKSVAQHGQRSCNDMLLGSSGVIEKCLWKIELEIKEYMHMVMETWKTTGCTLMFYNLKEAPLDQQKLVLGFYCPKGFIFAELPPSTRQMNSSQSFNYYEVGNALKNLVPDSSYKVWNHVIRFVQHAPCLQSGCHYQARDLSDTNESIDAFTMENPCTGETKCIRQQVLVFLRSICKASEKVRTLLNRSDEIFEFIVTSEMYGKFYKALKHKEVEQVGWGNDTNPFSRLYVVMGLQFELKSWLSQLGETERFHLRHSSDSRAMQLECTESIKDFWYREFWYAGKDLLRILAPLFKILSLFDTLVPTAGYVDDAIDKVRTLLKGYAKSDSYRYKPIWECFEKWRSTYAADSVYEATRCLNPSYTLRSNARVNLCSWCLYDLAEAYDDPQALDSEIKAYNVKSSNPFVNITISDCDANHPVTLWSKYGGGFPLLQKCAYKLLSQPSCCLCNQVQKQMSKLEGTDNYVLRLNALMMAEFAKMGDQTYQPIHI